MLAELRKILSASACLFSFLGFAAEPEAPPPIFAPKSKAATRPLEIPTRHLELSEHVHRLLAEDFLAKTMVFSATIPATSVVALPVDSAAVVMEKFLVRSSALRPVEFAKPVSPVLDLVKHGLLYHSVGKNLNLDGTLSFSQVTSYTSGSNGTAPKVEVRFNFRW